MREGAGAFSFQGEQCDSWSTYSKKQIKWGKENEKCGLGKEFARFEDVEIKNEEDRIRVDGRRDFQGKGKEGKRKKGKLEGDIRCAMLLGC